MLFLVNYSTSYRLSDTDFEPSKCAEPFSWQGEEFSKRQKQHPEIFYGKNLCKNNASLVGIKEDGLKPSLVKMEGVLVLAEHVSLIDKYLTGSPRHPFQYARQIFLIAITNATEPHFRKNAKKMLQKLWEHYGIADAMLITPCNDDPEV